MPALTDHDESSAQMRNSVKVPLISNLIAHAAHLLPAQGPIEVFVHHNTLHAFEEQPFSEAVKAGLAQYHAEPYLSEQEYRRLYSEGRIAESDLEAVLREELREHGQEDVSGIGTRADIWFAMLRHPLHIGPDAELKWVVAQTDALDRFREHTSQIDRTRIITSAKKWLEVAAVKEDSTGLLGSLLKRFGRNVYRWSERTWESFSLHLLWSVCLKGVGTFTSNVPCPRYVRPQQLLLHATGQDIDRNVHDVLIRFCAAYVDQGYSDWLLPNRDHGFFEAFLTLYRGKSLGLDRWLRRLSEEVELLSRKRVTAEASIEASLGELGIQEEDWQEFITESLLALGGWAGMIWQLESGVEWAVHSIPKGSLTGMLAVRLILEKHAIRFLGQEVFGESRSIPAILQAAKARISQPEPLNPERRAFLLFQVAQLLGWTPLELLQLSAAQWNELSQEIDRFSSIERRRIFHEAYERKYRHAALDALSVHTKRRLQMPVNRKCPPTFQIVTCIDDREESFRRHLEEVEPDCETFGAAGFFSVAMYYRGAAEGFYKPLCPGVVTPTNYVQEDVGYNFEGIHKSRAELRRRLGRASHLFSTRSRTLVGGMFAGIAGSLAAVPLVARVLFPHLTSRIRSRFGALLQPPPVTSLQLERSEEEPGPGNGHIGYSIDEMAGVVVRLLQDIGLTQTENFSRLFLVCGHGSSSLNNPHESAYCCGACAGKRGGPNARAFAQMANDWRVRSKVAERGIVIPDKTFFVGAYHNTCDDSVVFYDLDRLPASHRELFDDARVAIEEARRRNAHERCRRFDSAPLDMTPNEALRHVEARAQDISQARPEYNHATNAMCIVGRRCWSRGLFLDRRAFLTSYDPAQDDDQHSILLRVLSAAIPVCAGINLEYYFSRVDSVTYGSGSKLPHNIVSMLGVMEGTASDLRTGLYQQMVEIHEPMRLTFVIETTPDAMASVIRRNDAIGRLVRGRWIHLAILNPETSELQVYQDGMFVPYQPVGTSLPEVNSSLECYRGCRDHLPFFSIREAGGET